jgi:hypothetical protein
MKLKPGQRYKTKEWWPSPAFVVVRARLVFNKALRFERFSKRRFGLSQSNDRPMGWGKVFWVAWLLGVKFNHFGVV